MALFNRKAPKLKTYSTVSKVYFGFYKVFTIQTFSDLLRHLLLQVIEADDDTLVQLQQSLDT